MQGIPIPMAVPAVPTEWNHVKQERKLWAFNGGCQIGSYSDKSKNDFMDKVLQCTRCLPYTPRTPPQVLLLRLCYWVTLTLALTRVILKTPESRPRKNPRKKNPVFHRAGDNRNSENTGNFLSGDFSGVITFPGTFPGSLFFRGLFRAHCFSGDYCIRITVTIIA
jgi:hypothetical protein